MANEHVSFKYAGEPLLLCDPDGEFQAWLDRYLDTDAMNLFSWQTCFAVAGDNRPQWVHPHSRPMTTLSSLWSYRYWTMFGFKDDRAPITPNVGLPVINWPAPPRMQINSLWIPTGATRWAVGLFLVHETQLRKILSRTTNTETSGSLPDIWGRGSYLSFSVTRNGETAWQSYFLCPLTPRRVTCAKQGENLWLLPLVDHRYFWQFWNRPIPPQSIADLFVLSAIGSLQRPGPEVWHKFIHNVILSLGVQSTTGGLIADEVSASYAYPDAVEFGRSRANLAYMLDAAAACIGKRVVYDGGTTIRIEGPDYADQYLRKNLADNRDFQIAGGCAAFDFVTSGEPSYASPAVPNIATRNEFPSSVEVTFTENRSSFNCGFVSPFPASVAINGSELLGAIATSFFGGTKTFHDSAIISDDDPDADAAVIGPLITQIATDYYKWLGHTFDVSYAGLRPWRLTGFDDYVQYNFAVYDGSSGYLCTTRAASLPPNCSVSSMLHMLNPKWQLAASEDTESDETVSLTVVTDVYCDDGDIVVETADLHFDESGRLLAADNFDPPV